MISLTGMHKWFWNQNCVSSSFRCSISLQQIFVCDHVFALLEVLSNVSSIYASPNHHMLAFAPLIDKCSLFQRWEGTPDQNIVSWIRLITAHKLWSREICTFSACNWLLLCFDWHCLMQWGLCNVTIVCWSIAVYILHSQEAFSVLMV